jgi:hypothetical protein
LLIKHVEAAELLLGDSTIASVTPGVGDGAGSHSRLPTGSRDLVGDALRDGLVQV